MTGAIPPGPAEPCSTGPDLLPWLSEQFKRYGTIFKARIDGFSVYVVSDPELVQHVLRTNWRNYVKGWAIKRVALLLGNGLMASEGDLWQSQRRLIQPAFHRTAVDALIPAMRAGNAALLEQWRAAATKSEPVNVTRDVSFLVLEITLTAIFGTDAARMAPHFALLSEHPARDLKFAPALRSLGALVRELVAARRERGAAEGDVLGMLMATRDRESGAPMPERLLVNEILTLIVAGHETTASTLNWAWYLLSRHPEVAETLSRELGRLRSGPWPAPDDLATFPYTRQVLEEVLRLYPPGWLLTRKALQDDRLGDYFVPAGTEVYISPYLIQRSPQLWEDPDRFDPERFAPGRADGRHPLAMLPFSAGPRNCVGEAMARVEMQIHLMTVASALRLHFTDERAPELDVGINLRSKHDLMMWPEIKCVARASSDQVWR
jgi:cytochrome P450